MKLSKSRTLIFCFKSLALLSATHTLVSLDANADTCQVGDLTWQCVNQEEIVISNETGVFSGTAPEIELGLQYTQTTDENFISLIDGKVPSEFMFNLATRLKVSYSLKNGLIEAKTESGVKALPPGKFDKDGDPIDNQKIYESIKWYVHAPGTTPSDAEAITLSHPYDEFKLTPATCIEGYTVSVSAVPFTYTGVPDQGLIQYRPVLGTNGQPLLLENCQLINLISENVLLVITNQEGTYLVDQRYPDKPVNSDAKQGDELTVGLYVKKTNDVGEETYVDVTEDLLSTVVWGYALRKGDDIYGDGTLSEIDEEIWMDGTQKTSESVDKALRDTTGMKVFTVQSKNSEARALEASNQSEQSMRVMIKFGVTQ